MFKLFSSYLVYSKCIISTSSCLNFCSVSWCYFSLVSLFMYDLGVFESSATSLLFHAQAAYLHNNSVKGTPFYQYYYLCENAKYLAMLLLRSLTDLTFPTIGISSDLSPGSSHLKKLTLNCENLFPSQCKINIYIYQ